MKLVELAHQVIGPVLRSGDIAIDATVGNGKDTIFLAEKVGPAGKVYGFDIQPAAIAIARSRLRGQGLESRTRLVLGSHADLDRKLPLRHLRRIRAVMFNLGYLPGGDKSVTTTPQSTRTALQSACSHLARSGRISILCYTAHPGGQFETEEVKTLLTGLPDDFQFTIFKLDKTSRPPPELIIIERSEPFGPGVLVPLSYNRQASLQAAPQQVQSPGRRDGSLS